MKLFVPTLFFFLCLFLSACWANDLAPLVYRGEAVQTSSHKRSFAEAVSNGIDSFVGTFVKTSPASRAGSAVGPLKSTSSLKTVKEVDFKVSHSSKHSRRLLSRLPFFKGGSNHKRKILILMSDTGGGHRASAQALDQALQDQFPGKIDVEIMDIWTDHAPWPFNRFVPTYRFLAKHPILWRGFYAYGTFPLTRRITELWSWRTCYKPFTKAIRAANPDFVVSVHPLCQLMPITIIEDINRERAAKEKAKIPFVTIVTDLGGAHNTWFDNRADAYYVPSDAVRNLALKNGVESQKIILKGLPIRPSFWKESKPKLQIRKSLGIDESGKTVLLMGGGDGVGGLGSIASTLAGRLRKLNVPAQLIVICGHNKKMADSLKSKLGSQQDKLKVVVKGFVNNIDEFMAASDCLITKAGPGTIAESMIRGLPLILSSYLPGQEYGNVPYVVKGGFGVYTGMKPRKIADTVSSLFQNEDKLTQMSFRAKELSHPEATMSIARDIGETLLMKPVKTIHM